LKTKKKKPMYKDSNNISIHHILFEQNKLEYFIQNSLSQLQGPLHLKLTLYQHITSDYLLFIVIAISHTLALLLLLCWYSRQAIISPTTKKALNDDISFFLNGIVYL